MKKVYKLLLMSILIVPVFLLTACGGGNFTLGEITAKLVDKNYSFYVLANEDDEERVDLLDNIVVEYNAIIAEEDEDATPIAVTDLKVKSIAYAVKGDEKGYFFFCENEATAIIIAKSFTDEDNEPLGIKSPSIKQHKAFASVATSKLVKDLDLN